MPTLPDMKNRAIREMFANVPRWVSVAPAVRIAPPDYHHWEGKRARKCLKS
jgi:hypothetical protein